MRVKPFLPGMGGLALFCFAWGYACGAFPVWKWEALVFALVGWACFEWGAHLERAEREEQANE